MTPYESAEAFIKAYNAWHNLLNWDGLFRVGAHHETTDLLKTPRAEVYANAIKVMPAELVQEYKDVMGVVDAFTLKMRNLKVKSREAMDATHLKMLETCFPKDFKGRYTVKNRSMPITFTMSDRSYISAYVANGEKNTKPICGYIDIKSHEVGNKHCRFQISEDNVIWLTTEEDLY